MARLTSVPPGEHTASNLDGGKSFLLFCIGCVAEAVVRILTVHYKKRKKKFRLSIRRQESESCLVGQNQQQHHRPEND
jgi:hypothetical protein